MGATVHKFRGKDRDFHGMERGHDSDIQHPVDNRSKRSYPRLVTPLVHIAYGYENRRKDIFLSVHIYIISIAGEVMPAVPGLLDIGPKATPGRIRESSGNLGIQPHAYRTEKRAGIDKGVVNHLGPALQYGFKRRGDSPADTEMKGKAVAAAAGNYSQGLFRTYQSAGDLAHGPVSSDGDHNVGVAEPGKLLCVGSILGHLYLIFQRRRRQSGAYGSDNPALVLSSGNRIDYEKNFFHRRGSKRKQIYRFFSEKSCILILNHTYLHPV